MIEVGFDVALVSGEFVLGVGAAEATAHVGVGFTIRVEVVAFDDCRRGIGSYESRRTKMVLVKEIGSPHSVLAYHSPAEVEIGGVETAAG